MVVIQIGTSEKLDTYSAGNDGWTGTRVDIFAPLHFEAALFLCIMLGTASTFQLRAILAGSWHTCMQAQLYQTPFGQQHLR